eukprot:4671929-Pleurochrysis_carterae.AAC.1
MPAAAADVGDHAGAHNGVEAADSVGTSHADPCGDAGRGYDQAAAHVAVVGRESGLSAAEQRLLSVGAATALRPQSSARGRRCAQSRAGCARAASPLLLGAHTAGPLDSSCHSTLRLHLVRRCVPLPPRLLRRRRKLLHVPWSPPPPLPPPPPSPSPQPQQSRHAAHRFVASLPHARIQTDVIPRTEPPPRPEHENQGTPCCSHCTRPLSAPECGSQATPLVPHATRRLSQRDGAR